MPATDLPPFVGPSPFQRQDEIRFFGRDREANELASRIIAHTEVLLYAQSGAGKTSLINARLIPLLEEKGCEVLPLARLQGPLQGIDPASVPNIYVFHTLRSWTESDLDPRSTAGMTLPGYLNERKHPTDELTLSSPHVAIFDQFEELFTFYPERWPERQEFFEQIRDALKADPLLRFVFSMREDHVAKLDPYATVLPERLRTRFRLERLRERTALLAVKEPVTKLTQRHFADGVAEALVKDLLETGVEGPDHSVTVVKEEFVEPVQLQVVCQGLWQSLPPDVIEITREHLKASGDTNKSLADFYEESVRRAAATHGIKEGALRRWFEKVLITPAGTRGMVFRGEEETGDIPNKVVETLEDAHLIRAEMHSGAPWYELTHDRFLEPIRASNRKWLALHARAEEGRQWLERRAEEWAQKGGSNQGLLDEAELLQADRWLSSQESTDLGYNKTLVVPFIHTSRAAVEAAKRQAKELTQAARRLRWLSFALGLALLAAMATAVFSLIEWKRALNATKEAEGARIQAIKQRNVANTQRITAEHYANLSENRTKLSSAWELLAQPIEKTRLHPENSLRNVRRAYQMVQEAKVPIDKQNVWDDKLETTAKYVKKRTDTTLQLIEQTLRQALSASRSGIVARGHQGAVNLALFHPDGKTILTVGGDRTARVWDAHTGQQKYKRITRHDTTFFRRFPGSAARAFVASADGRRLVVLKTIEDSNVSGKPEQENTLHGFTNPSQFGKSDATAKASNTRAYLLTIHENKADEQQIASDRSENVLCATVSANGKWVTVGYEGSGTVLVIDTTGEQDPKEIKEEGAIAFMVLSPDGSRLLTIPARNAGVDTDTNPRLWNVNMMDKRKGSSLLVGHRGRVTQAVFSPDGKHLATAATDDTMRLWDACTGRALHTQRVYLGMVPWIRFSPDGHTVAITGALDTFVFEVETGKLVCILGGRSQWILDIAFSPDSKRIATSSGDGAAKVWEARTGNLIEEFRGHVGAVTCIAFSPDSKRVVTGGMDKTVRVWDVEAPWLPLRVAELRGHTAQVTGGVFSRNGDLMVTLGRDNTALLWKGGAAAGVPKLVRALRHHKGPIIAASFSQGDRFLATAGTDLTTCVWDPRTGDLLAELSHPEPLVSVAFHPTEGKVLLCAGRDGTAQAWDVSARKKLFECRGHQGPLTGAAFSPDGKWIVTTGEDNTVRVWDARTGAEAYRKKGHSTPLLSQAFSGREGGYLVTANAGVPRSTGNEGAAEVFDAGTRRPVGELPGQQGPVTAVLYSPDGKLLVTGGADGKLRLWEAGTRKLLRELIGHTGAVSMVAFSREGKRLVSEAKDGLGKVWDVNTGKTIATLPGLLGPVAAVAISPDGSKVAAESHSNQARVWDLATGTSLMLQGHTDVISGVAFSPDGQLVATASWDKTARVWRTDSGTQVTKMSGHKGRLLWVEFRPDGKSLLTSSQDGTARRWQVSTGQEVVTFAGSGLGSVTSAVFSPDGKSLITLSAGQAPQTWDVATGKPVGQLPGFQGSWPQAFYNPEGTLVLTTHPGRPASVWNSSTGKRMAELETRLDSLFSAAFSPDGKMLVTVGQGEWRAKVWDTHTGKMLVELKGHAGAVNRAAISPDNKLLLTGAQDSSARIWDLRSGERLRELPGHTRGVLQVTFSPDGKWTATADADGEVRVWDVGTGKLVQEINAHRGGVLHIAFSPPDSEFLVTAGSDQVARVWERGSGKIVSTFQAHRAAVQSAAFSPDGRLVVTAGADRTVQVWERGTGRRKFPGLVGGHAGPVTRASFSGDGQWVVTAGDDQTARVWDAVTGASRAVFREHRGAVKRALFTPDGESVVTMGSDNRALIWDWKKGNTKWHPLGREMDTVSSAAFSPDGRRVVTASQDIFGSKVRLWEVGTAKMVQELATPEGNLFRRPVFSPDGKTLAAVGDDQTARLWDANTGKLLHSFKGHRGAVNSVAFSPDGKVLATASDDQTARLWDTTRGELLKELRGHEGKVSRAVFSPDGTLLATSSADNTARLWEAATGKCLHVLRGHKGPPQNSITFSPDGRRVLTSSEDKTARVWDVKTGKLLCVLEHDDLVYSATFSPDGKHVLTGCQNRLAWVWNIETKTVLYKLGVHRSRVVWVAYSPKGQYMATACDGGTVRVWSERSGKLVADLFGHRKGVTSLAFSTNGQRLLTASRDGTACVWEVPRGTRVANLGGDGASLNDLAISPDGKFITTGSGSLIRSTKDALSAALVWESRTGNPAPVHEFQGNIGAVISAAFRPPNGRMLITVEESTAPRLWDTNSGKLLATLSGHSMPVKSAVFSDNGKFLLTSSNDGTARIWHIPSPELIGPHSTLEADAVETLAVLRSPKGPVTHAAFSPDSKSVLVIGEDNTARVYYYALCGSLDDLLLLAKRRLESVVTKSPSLLPGGE